MFPPPTNYFPYFGMNQTSPQANDDTNFKKVFIGNLSYSTNWKILKDYVKKIADVAFADVFQDEKGRSRGCGVVEFHNNHDAKKCIEKLNQSNLDGRMIYYRDDAVQNSYNIGIPENSHSSHRKRSRSRSHEKPRSRDRNDNRSHEKTESIQKSYDNLNNALEKVEKLCINAKENPINKSKLADLLHKVRTRVNYLLENYFDEGKEGINEIEVKKYAEVLIDAVKNSLK